MVRLSIVLPYVVLYVSPVIDPQIIFATFDAGLADVLAFVLFVKCSSLKCDVQVSDF